MELTSQERALCARVGFDEALGQLLQNATGNPVEQAFCYDHEIEPVAANALSSATSAAYSHLEAARAALPDPYRAYIGIRREPSGSEIGQEIVVLRDTDPLAFVRCRRPMAPLRHLRRSGFGEVGRLAGALRPRYYAGRSRSGRIPFRVVAGDLMALAEEIFWFCEDVTDVAGDGIDIERDRSC